MIWTNNTWNYYYYYYPTSTDVDILPYLENTCTNTFHSGSYLVSFLAIHSFHFIFFTQCPPTLVVLEILFMLKLLNYNLFLVYFYDFTILWFLWFYSCWNYLSTTCFLYIVCAVEVFVFVFVWCFFYPHMMFFTPIWCFIHDFFFCFGQSLAPFTKMRGKVVWFLRRGWNYSITSLQAQAYLFIQIKNSQFSLF